MLNTIASLSEHRSSQLKTSVFVRPRVKEKPAFPNISTLESVFEKSVLGDRFHLIRVDNRPNRRKKIPVFKQKLMHVDGAFNRFNAMHRVHVIFFIYQPLTVGQR